MKKLTTLLLLVFISTASFAQADTTITTTERIIDKYGGKISESFNSVVEKITPVAEQGFVIAVRLSIAEGVGYLVASLLFPFLITGFIKEYNRVEKMLATENPPRHLNSSYGPFSEYNANPKMIISLFGSIVSGVAFPFLVWNGLARLIAPEWYAIENIIELFK